jgi:hypothetical protein
MRILALLTLVPLVVSGSEIFTRDGVTDGDTFYLAPRAYSDDDPVLQSWVTYSLRHLVEAWEAQRTEHEGATDSYLDDLLRVRDAGFLDEYTVHYFGKKHWQVPAEVRVDDFREWQRRNLRKHKPQMRLIGSWNYRPL